MIETLKRAVAAVGDRERVAASLDRRIRTLRTRFEPPPAINPLEIDLTPDQSPADASRRLHANGAVAVRGAIKAPKRLNDFARDRVVTPRSDGDNMLYFISERERDEFVTDFWLIRQALSPRLVEIASKYFQDTAGTPAFYLPYNNLLIRRFHAAESGRDLFVPFHQDGGGFPRGTVMLNCWTPLYPDECGETSPGLELAPVLPRHLLAIEQGSASKHYNTLEAQHAFQRRFKGRAPITPSLKLGDVLVFNGRCLHRTSTRTGLPLPRVSAEIRLIAANAAGIAQARKSAHALVDSGVINWRSRFRREGGNLVGLDYAAARL